MTPEASRPAPAAGPGREPGARLRLFVAAWPPAPAIEALRGLDRPVDAPVRWTTPEQWHVTLRFLGDVDAGAVPALEAAAASALASVPAPAAVLGPATERLGRETLAVPVVGLDALAAAVAQATAPWGWPLEDRDFFGHVTLARSRRRAAVPAHLAGRPVAATWTAGEVSLIRSRLGPGGARYEDLATVALAPP